MKRLFFILTSKLRFVNSKFYNLSLFFALLTMLKTFRKKFFTANFRIAYLGFLLYRGMKKLPKSV
ncbi:MAG TPA: hypothetical protein DDY77_01575 [Clostridiales bacterium]|nr:hypothetical protein [Clostridiales bacterium]